MADNAITQDAKKDSDKKRNDIVAQKEDVKKSSTADLIAELPDDMPPEVKRIISMGMMQASHQGGSPRSHPLFEKFTEDHVDKYLDYVQKDDDNEYNLRSSNRWFALLYTLIGVTFFGFLIVYLLPKDKALLNDILKLLITFAGGVGSGYGLKSYIESRK